MFYSIGPWTFPPLLQNHLDFLRNLLGCKTEVGPIKLLLE
jgi:hypothetical protein